MRTVDNQAIKAHGAVRFRSEYHYATFEYWRSAKLLGCLERGGVRALGRVLDDGCGSGGMCVSIAEEAESVVGIDLVDRFSDAGVRLAGEKGVRNLTFARADGTALPFARGSFDQVLSHAVIEHVADPPAYLREARRVLKPGGAFFLQTSTYLSPTGAHLPRLKVPIPLHLVMGRRAAFAVSCWLAKHKPHYLNADRDASSFIALVERGEKKVDDLLYHVTIGNLRRNIRQAGFTLVREDLYVSNLAVKYLPKSVSSLVPRVPFVRDVLVTTLEFLVTA